MTRIVKKATERRREILWVSRSLFLSKGYENTTMQDIITKGEIAKGTAYHYFKSKEEILEAVVEEMVSEYMVVIEKELNECQGNALEKMKVLVSAGRMAPKQTELMDNLHRSGNMGMHTRLLAVMISKLAPLYAKVISQGCEERMFRAEHPLACAEILLAGIQFITDIGCYPWQPHDLKRRAEAIPQLIENQLNAPKDSFRFLFNQD